MKTALVTGASSGIGLAISKYLIEHNFVVYGIARQFDSCDLSDANFKQSRCDVTEPSQIKGICNDVMNQHDRRLDLLVNNAGVASFGPYETLPMEEIIRMVDTNLRAPLLFTNRLLRGLRNAEGTIINISSITAEIISPWGNAYAATKAGLMHFGDTLFNEVRKSGVSVVNILPDLTDTPFYDELDFKPHENSLAHLKTEDVVKAVELVLNQRKGSVVTQINLRPQKMQIERK